MPDQVVAVAYSGGRDSTALLHATLLAAREQSLRVVALHVNHGLSPNALAWEAHCERACAAWARKGWPVQFARVRLGLRPRRGDSIESVARQARYRALRALAAEHGASVVLLAHHRRDQAETFLLQALRGAGVAGLAGMPRVVERDGIVWMRPWLDHPREWIEAYVRRHRLRFIDDASNTDDRFARNRLRLKVWPALIQAFPQVEQVLSDAAAWAAEASECLGELARADLGAVARDSAVQRLQVRALLDLGPARARNALRHWFRLQVGVPMPAALLARLWAELPRVKLAQWPAQGGSMRLYRGTLSWNPGAAVAADRLVAPRESGLRIAGPGRYPMPGWGGALVVEIVPAQGVPLSLLSDLELGARSGGERFQQAPNRPARSLKKQFQEAAIPPWARNGPLVRAHGRLVFVPGLGVDARCWAAAGVPQVGLRWVPEREFGDNGA